MDTSEQPPSWDDRDTVRTGSSVAALKRAYLDNLFYLQGKFLDVATPWDVYMAAAYTVRDRVMARWIRTARRYKESRARTVCYFSAEFLVGPHLANNAVNLGIDEAAKQAAAELELDFEQILEEEEEPGLGNGGLGRLAACYMDSMATLQIPSIGYGIRYEYGIFDQEIVDGWQREVSDLWLRNGNPWELARPKLRFPVAFGGHTRQFTDGEGRLRVEWKPEVVIDGMAYDTPIQGYGVDNLNLLRLWRSEAPASFDFQAFNLGDYYQAVEAKVRAENISKVLYPNDEPVAGKELRLKQQYFFVSCSLQDMLRMHLGLGGRLEDFSDKYAVQLNDTHPAIAVPELMRLLLDEHLMSWEAAWDIVRRTFAFTNHTLLPEALEVWPVELLGRLLPRHLEIIYEINRRFLDEVRMRYPLDEERIARMSIIDESGGRRVRMAHLATVGSSAVNGVAELHTELLKTTVMRDFRDLWPDRFHNVTNGVTPRRFLRLSNPDLARLISETTGSDDWITHLDRLRELEQHADDAAFQERWRSVKRGARSRLADVVRRKTGIRLDPDSLFDIQVKRIHEYKRQHLNVLHIVTLYNRIKQDPDIEMVPRSFIFGGKAAPGYFMAKLMIKLINAVGDVVNRDPQVNRLLRVAFYPNFNVKNAHGIYPAADLSEQISLAGKEASGTGNMKFSLNGALTIGTLDGANVEIREEVGAENFFLFGMTVEEVARLRAEGYRPADFIHHTEELRAALDLLDSGVFAHGDRELFRPLTDDLRNRDPFMLCADYLSYVEAQSEVDRAWHDEHHWTHMAILNVARMGKFSSDRSIRDYCRDIWKVEPGSAVAQDSV
ncbi:MAG TPA: glycogen/starch/alpha-glucan phosphorylase [Gammaproteobacteria bacterium]|nr:glycogen/starch/alpha-glucan phosphorylase [Gammaproteobacteria bacterium]